MVRGDDQDPTILAERLRVLTDDVAEIREDLRVFKSWGLRALTGGSVFLLYQVARGIPALAEFWK
jgi:hypothetical protein